MERLSKTQLAILRRMGEGAVVQWVDVPVNAYFWEGSTVMNNPRPQSMEVLIRYDFVAPHLEPWWGRIYTITPAGRAYLEEHDG